MRKFNLIRRLLSRVLPGLVLIPAITAVVAAQGPLPEDTLRQLDRNGNNAIDPEEWETMPSGVRQAFEGRGIDFSVSMEFDDFLGQVRNIGDDTISRLPPASAGRQEPPPAEQPPADEPKREKVVIRVVRPKSSRTNKLPEAYRAKDKDQDGQIGQYEWPLSDYKAFRKLDLNGDGFLTAQELTKGAKGATEVARRGSSRPSSSTASEKADSKKDASDNSSGSSSALPDAPSGPPPAAPKNPAETAFKLLDKDPKDGTVSEKEWNKSLMMKPKFDAAGVKVTLPLRKETFLQLYPQVFPNAGK